MRRLLAVVLVLAGCTAATAAEATTPEAAACRSSAQVRPPFDGHRSTATFDDVEYVGHIAYDTST